MALFHRLLLILIACLAVGLTLAGARRRLYDGFRANGGNAKFVAAPPYGDDGHYLYSVVARPQWTPYVDAFLRERGLNHDLLAGATRQITTDQSVRTR